MENESAPNIHNPEKVKEEQPLISSGPENELPPTEVPMPESSTNEEVEQELSDLYAKLDDGEQDSLEVSQETTTPRQKIEPNKPGVFGSFKKWAKGLVLAGAVVTGSAEMTDSAQAQDKTVEKKENSKEYEKNRDYLREVFAAISGGGLAKSKKEGLIVHVGGGKYYELSSPMLGDLVVLAGDYRGKIERTKNKDVVVTLRRASQMRIREEVSKRGVVVPINELPQVLKDFEKARKETKDNQE